MDDKSSPFAGLRAYGSSSDAPTWRTRVLYLGVLGALVLGAVLLAVLGHPVHHGHMGICNSFPPSPVTPGHTWVCAVGNVWKLVAQHS